MSGAIECTLYHQSSSVGRAVGVKPVFYSSFTRMTINLFDLYVFAPDGQTTHTSFSLVINPVHVCGIFLPSADAESAKRVTPHSLVYFISPRQSFLKWSEFSLPVAFIIIHFSFLSALSPAGPSPPI
jgi:hypothetical protein